MAGTRKYSRPAKADRHAIQAALDGRGSCRSIAGDLGRSPSSVFDEVKRNRVVRRGPGKGERVAEVPGDACPRPLSWPYVCNGRKRRNHHCPMAWQAECRAARAQALADEEPSAPRRGVDKTRGQFELIMARVSEGLGRGLSPEQVVGAYQPGASVSTVYGWVGLGYAGTSSLMLRRKVGYRPRRRSQPPRSASHGEERSFAAFMALGEEERAAACEMDTVQGRARDSKCLLTLYLRPCKLQLALLLEEKTTEEAARTLDALEGVLGRDGFGRLFDPLLTDNGSESSDHGPIERSAGGGAPRRARVFFCDVRQSQQKGSRERNHEETRKVIPKGTSMGGLSRADCALLMSHVNSEPRPSLAGLSPIRMFRLAYGGLAEDLLDAVGVEEVPVGELDLTPSLLARDGGRDPAV